MNVDELARELIRGLDAVVPRDTPRPIALHEPEFGEDEQHLVGECIRSGWVSSVGSYVDEFEDCLRQLTGSKFAVAMASGTAALQLALHVLGVRPGDEVLVPTLSFVATANAVSHCGAIPHFIDSEASTLGLDPGALRERLHAVGLRNETNLLNRETGRRISAVIPMHAFGLACKIEEIALVADEFGLPVIEDAAESLGTHLETHHCGRVGRAAMLSFNGNKIVTTGNGGAIITDDEAIAASCKHLSTTAKLKHPWRFDHDQIGWNYRLPNLNAALGVAQLKRLDDIARRKRQLHDSYVTELKDNPNMTMISERPGTRSNYWLNTIRIPSITFQERESLLTRLHQEGYLCRPAWTLLHKLPMYTGSPRGELSQAAMLENELINLPSGPRLRK